MTEYHHEYIALSQTSAHYPRERASLFHPEEGAGLFMFFAFLGLAMAGAIYLGWVERSQEADLVEQVKQQVTALHPAVDADETHQLSEALIGIRQIEAHQGGAADVSMFDHPQPGHPFYECLRNRQRCEDLAGIWDENYTAAQVRNALNRR